MSAENKHLVLICGESNGGKTASLRNLKKPEGVIYLNCESNKFCPFPNKFKTYSITDPYQVYEAFNYVKDKPEYHTIVIDTLTFLMDMFYTNHIYESKDSMAGWAAYQQYFKKLMQQYVAKAKVNVIILAHVQQILNDQAMILEKKVPVQGSLAKNGIEAYFNTVIGAKRALLKELEQYSNKLLTITEEEKTLGFKFVYQTKLTKGTISERIRASIGMWDQQETYIDNDAQLVLDRLHEYYK